MKKEIRKNKPKIEPFPIVAIGASAGGLEAMTALLKVLPANTGMAYIYVQHLSPDHKSLLTSILSKITKMKVQEVEDMDHMEPNNVYVIPPNKGIKVTNGHIRLLPHSTKVPAVSIDVLFSSLAQTHKENVIGIILSGYASDGVAGLKAIKDAGGVTFAQDNSAQAESMPKAAIASGNVDFVLSPEEIAVELTRFKSSDLKKVQPAENRIPNLENTNYDIYTIFELLLKRYNVDFSHYKIATIQRRLDHQLQEHGIKNLKEYVELLVKDTKELEIVYNDFLINVTSFFRDKEAFQYLKTTLFPKILDQKTQKETFRIWVPACSTGQEAYTIAIILAELQEVSKSRIPVKIFATDLSAKAIKHARTGAYSADDVKNLPKKCLEKYFKLKGETYYVEKELREMCVFAPHNVLRDPPFSKLDFISCRNVLIYFDTLAQKKVFATLHFALNENGYIMLGKAETVGTSSLLFTQVNTKFKIYSRTKNTSTRRFNDLIPRFPLTNLSDEKMTQPIKNLNVYPAGIDAAIDSVLLTKHMPACVVINKEMEILQFRGAVSTFLTHPSGKASLNVLKMTRSEFTFELRNAIQKVIKTSQAIKITDIEIHVDGFQKKMAFEVSPLKIDKEEPLLLIVFTILEQTITYSDDKDSETDIGSQKDARIKSLVEELNKLRLEVNSILESQEKTYEELQAANEEIVSTNEEFQTLNEELETSKEEIEATNEELITTNQELQVRNERVTELNEYSKAVLATIHEPMLVLTDKLHVCSANDAFYTTFNVSKEETIGKSLFQLGNKQWNIEKLKKILTSILSKDTCLDNFEVIHTFPGIGEKVMLLNAHLIVQKAKSEKLILLAIADITDRAKYYIKEMYANSLIEASLDPLIVIDTTGKITDMNKATSDIMGVPRENIKNSKFFNYFTEPKKASEFYKKVFSNGSITNAPLTIRHKNGRLTDVTFNGSVYKDSHDAVHGIVMVGRDVTEQKRITAALAEANVFAEKAKVQAEKNTSIAEKAMKSKQFFLSNMSHEIRTPMNAIVGFTNVLEKTSLSPKQQEYIEAIKVSSDTLIVLINDILDLAKVDAGKMSFEKIPFNLTESLTALNPIFESKMSENDLKLIKEYDSNIPEIIVGDQVRLRQILLNLMSNAIKFTSKGEVKISTLLKEEDAKNVTIEFSVSDTGIGIQEAELKNIFNHFEQASNDTARIYGGTGLGLAIVKQLVESQGGSVAVKSTVNKGSTFSFSLKFKKSTAKVMKKQKVTPLKIQTRNINILVAEDVALNQLLIKTILEEFKFQYDIVSNGKEAVDQLKNNQYDLILMDLQMPVMNGFEATEHIRKVLKSKIPIIALSADVTTVGVEICKDAGMDDYLAKPIDEKLLYAKILETVEKEKSVK